MKPQKGILSDIDDQNTEINWQNKELYWVFFILLVYEAILGADYPVFV